MEYLTASPLDPHTAHAKPAGLVSPLSCSAPETNPGASIVTGVGITGLIPIDSGC